MKRRRIVHLIASLKMGGAEVMLAMLLREFQQQFPGYEHYVVYIHDGPLRKDIERLGIITYAASSAYFRYTPWRIIQLVREIRPDIIHSSLWITNWFARWIAWWFSLPLVSVIHSPLQHRGIVRMLLDFGAPKSRGTYVGVSDAIVHEIKKVYRPINDAVKIHNGVCAATRMNRALSRIWTVGAVGRLVPLKQFDLLIRASALLVPLFPELRVLIIGDGPERRRLVRLAQDLCVDDKIIFMGEVPARDYYGQFDCFVQPSAYEGLSLALLEALSVGVPVIVTGREQHHEVITHEVHGLVIKSGCIDAIIGAIKHLMMHPDDRDRYGRQALLRYQEHFTVSTMAQSYERLFNQVVEENRPQLLQ